jgi:hypothetical protein
MIGTSAAFLARVPIVTDSSSVSLHDRRVRRMRKQSLAKSGLIATLGTLTVTALVHGKLSRGVHVAAGIALLGLAAWHHSLYPQKKKKNKAGD